MRQRPHPFDHEAPGRRLVLRPSLRAETAPPPGPVDPPFYWPDLLGERMPGEEERGPPVLCLAGQEMLFEGVRVENPLLVREVDERVEVEDRLSVTERALAGVLEAERTLVGQKLEDIKRGAEERADAADGAVATNVHKGHAKLAGALRRVTAGLAALPDRTKIHAQRAAAFLSTPEGRQKFRRGLVDPHGLSGEQKAVTFFVILSATLLTLALTHFVVTLAAPDVARPWRTVFLLFLYLLGSSFGVPFPIEPAIVAAALAVGAVTAIAVALIAKVIAAYLVFFVGDEVHAKLERRAAKSERFARFLAACERFAARFGAFAVAAFIATPGLPDFIALYIFGALHMKLSRFLAGVAVGGLILYSVLTLGVLSFLH